MVKPVDQVSIQVLQIIGVTLPILILALETFDAGERDYNRDVAGFAVVSLAVAAILAAVSWLIGNNLENLIQVYVISPFHVENPLVNVAIVSLTLGFALIGYVLYDLLNINLRRYTIYYLVYVLLLALVFGFSFILNPMNGLLG